MMMMTMKMKMIWQMVNYNFKILKLVNELKKHVYIDEQILKKELIGDKTT